MAAELRQPPSIDGFGQDGFRIGGVRIEGSALIVGEVSKAWAPRSLSELTPVDFAPVFASDPADVELLILGVGARMAPAPRAVREAFAAAGLGLEIATTPEACRLYNMLTRDGRRIAAALVAVA